MARVNGEAIRTAIRQRLEGVLSSPRSLAPGEASGDLFVGADDYTAQMRSTVIPRFTVRITAQSRNEASPSAPSAPRLINISVSITAFRKAPNPATLPEEYEKEKAAADSMVDAMARSLEYPGALSATLAGVPTGLVSGLLRWTSSSTTREDPATGLYEITTSYEGIVLVDADAP